MFFMLLAVFLHCILTIWVLVNYRHRHWFFFHLVQMASEPQGAALLSSNWCRWNLFLQVASDGADGEVTWSGCISLSFRLTLGTLPPLCGNRGCASWGLWSIWKWWWGVLFLQLVQVRAVSVGPSDAAGDGCGEAWLQETWLLTSCWGWDGLMDGQRKYPWSKA